jgi:hypothetical protein
VLLQISKLAKRGFVQLSVLSRVSCAGGKMKSVRQVSSLLLAASCAAQFSQAAFAQTVLTGQVSSVGDMQPLLPRQPQFDNTPNYGTTTVNPNLRSAGAQNQNLQGGAGYSNLQGGSPAYTNLQGGAGQNFRPQRPIIHTVYIKDNRTFFQRHPMVKAATIGAGVGAGAGALTGLVTGRGVIRGALIGGGAGAGVGIVRSSQIMRRHPILRDVATGSLVGLGLGAAASRGHRLPLQATGVGAAVGLGIGLFKNLR